MSRRTARDRDIDVKTFLESLRERDEQAEADNARNVKLYRQQRRGKSEVNREGPKPLQLDPT